MRAGTKMQSCSRKGSFGSNQPRKSKTLFSAQKKNVETNNYSQAVHLESSVFRIRTSKRHSLQLTAKTTKIAFYIEHWDLLSSWRISKLNENYLPMMSWILKCWAYKVFDDSMVIKNARMLSNTLAKVANVCASP